MFLLRGLIVLLVAVPAAAQDVQMNIVTATVPSLGAVLAVSPLTPGGRLPTADLFVAGTVTTRHNGPYLLQARLTQPFTSTPGSGAGVHEVRARTPDGDLVSLGTAEWLTVSIGPGGSELVNAVEYLVVWAQTGQRNPATAVLIPLEYRVVPP